MIIITAAAHDTVYAGREIRVIIAAKGFRKAVKFISERPAASTRGRTTIMTNIMVSRAFLEKKKKANNPVGGDRTHAILMAVVRHARCDALKYYQFAGSAADTF